MKPDRGDDVAAHSHCRADPLLRRAVLLRPNSAGARMGLAETLLSQNQPAAARKELEQVVRQWPEFGAAHARLAEVYMKAGLTAEASREKSLAAKFTAKTGSITDPGPKPGTPAPRLQLPRADGTGPLKVPCPGKPEVLVFGSYSCPNFRSAS